MVGLSAARILGMGAHHGLLQYHNSLNVASYSKTVTKKGARVNLFKVTPLLINKELSEKHRVVEV